MGRVFALVGLTIISILISLLTLSIKTSLYSISPGTAQTRWGGQERTIRRGSELAHPSLPR